MKKLMIVAAAAAMVASAQAGIAVKTVNCNPAAGVAAPCDEIVFKVTGSGKALDEVSKEYATVSKLKVNGWLVMFPAIGGFDAQGNPQCCYPYYSLYVSARIGRNTTNLIFDGAGAELVDAWTIFGKKLDKARESTTMELGSKSKKYKLDSQLGISADYVGGNASGTLVYAEDVAAANAAPLVTFIATAFGKATWKTNVTGACEKCKKPTLDGVEITPGTYSGWFAGFYAGSADEECLTCTCSFLNVFGGTWKAKYQEKVATWEAAVRDVFGANVLSNMVTEGLPSADYDGSDIIE